MRALSSIVVSVLVLAASGRAAAQMSTGELVDARADSRVAGELGFFYRTFNAGTRTTDIGGIQPSFYLTYKMVDLGENGFLDLDVDWQSIGIFGNTSTFRAMNPYVGVRAGVRGGDTAQQWRVRGGGGLTIPLSNAYDDWGSLTSPGLTATIVGLGMQAAWSEWLQAPLNMAVVVRGDAELRGTAYTVGVEGAFGAMIPVTYKGMTGSTAMNWQIGGWAGWRALPELVVGLRLQAILFYSTQTKNAEGQTALMPFVRGEFGDGFVEGRLLMNLDDPLGWAFDGSSLHFWAVQVLGGSAF